MRKRPIPRRQREAAMQRIFSDLEVDARDAASRVFNHALARLAVVSPRTNVDRMVERFEKAWLGAIGR